MVHDYNKFPELTNEQLQTEQFSSPHVQITEDFEAEVVKVHDGDTITLRVPFRDFDFPLRFLNIDSPEMNAGGEIARDWVKSQIEGKKVQIRIDKKNRVGKYGRLLGVVIGNGVDIGAMEIRLGYCKPYGKKLEGQLPIMDKILSMKQWF